MLRQRRKGRPGVRRGLRIVARLAALVAVAEAGLLVIPALIAPGNDDVAAKVAENARDHGLGFVVTAAEWVQYRMNPPTVGGSLDAASRSRLASDASSPPASSPSGSAASSPPASSPGASSPAASSPAAAPTPALHDPLAPVITPALPGEGDFVARVSVAGRPAVQTALLRPDSAHPGYLAGVAWMNGGLLRFVQHPGATDPGRLSLWSQPAVVPASQRSGLVATFNSGFRIADSRGAFYADGHGIGSLRTGAASLVIYSDGHVDIGAWGTDVRLSGDVASVRQNLNLLISGGQLTPEVDGDTQSTWGATIGQRAYVWRSGVGVTATGDVVFVAGDALSARSLATLLQRAGAVRAMELDINRSWVSYMWYSPDATGATPQPHKLVDFARPADRYYTVNNRDFFAVYAR